MPKRGGEKPLIGVSPADRGGSASKDDVLGEDSLRRRDRHLPRGEAVEGSELDRPRRRRKGSSTEPIEVVWWKVDGVRQKETSTRLEIRDNAREHKIELRATLGGMQHTAKGTLHVKTEATFRAE